MPSYKKKRLGVRFYYLKTTRLEFDGVSLEVVALPDVARGLQIADRTLRGWLVDPIFIGAGVAQKIGARWYFKKHLLGEWLIARGALSPREGSSGGFVQSNPPKSRNANRKARRNKARERLGL